MQHLLETTVSLPVYEQKDVYSSGIYLSVTFGLWTGMGPRKQVLHRVYIGALLSLVQNIDGKLLAKAVCRCGLLRDRDLYF